jgi:integrase
MRPPRISRSTDVLTIRAASESWIANLESRKRRPAKAATLQTFRSYLKFHIEPNLGNLPVASVTNATLRDFVVQLTTAKLAPKTIQAILSALKSVVASVVNPVTGDCIYPHVWNSDFIDAPIVENQNQPIVSVQDLERALSVANAQDRALWALASGSGARIGELLALRVGFSDASSYWNCTDATLMIRTSIFAGHEQAPKTKNSLRTIELAEPLNNLLKDFVGSRTNGFLFGNGRSANISTLRTHLDKHLPGFGFHAFRRFRTTTLRASRCEPQVEAYWLGHSPGQSMTDKYSKLYLDQSFRRQECERIGLGFVLPGTC